MWGVADVATWVQSQCSADEAERIGASFSDAEVDGDMLLELDEECLQELGVRPASLRGTMLAGINKLSRRSEGGFAHEMVPTVVVEPEKPKPKPKAEKHREKASEKPKVKKKKKKKIRRGKGIKR